MIHLHDALVKRIRNLQRTNKVYRWDQKHSDEPVESQRRSHTLLLNCFYENCLQKGLSVRTALEDAQLWMRGQELYRNPVVCGKRCFKYLL